MLSMLELLYHILCLVSIDLLADLDRNKLQNFKLYLETSLPFKIRIIKMDINHEVDLNKIDALGSHFKYKDLCLRLRTVIQENKSEKRSADLLAYQAYFTQNQPLSAKKQQQMRQYKTSETDSENIQHAVEKSFQQQLIEPNSSIERQPRLQGKTSLMLNGQSPMTKAQQQIGQEKTSSRIHPQQTHLTVRHIDQNYATQISPKKVEVVQPQNSQKLAISTKLQDKFNKADRVGFGTIANKTMNNKPHIVNLNANQLNLVVSFSDHMNNKEENTKISTGSEIKHNGSSYGRTGQISVGGVSLQPQQSTHLDTKMRRSSQNDIDENNLRQRHSSMDEIIQSSSDYSHTKHQHLYVQRDSIVAEQQKSLSKISSGRLRNDYQRQVFDKYSTTQHFAVGNQAAQNRAKLTIEPSPMRFNIGQIRAASVMEANEDSRITLEKRRARNNNEKLVPVGSTAYPKFYEQGGTISEYGSLQVNQATQKGLKKLPQKINRTLLPKV